MKNLSPALVASLILSLSLGKVVVAQFNPPSPAPEPNSGQKPNSEPPLPSPTQRPGGASQAPQLFQGESRNLNFNDALNEALNKARKSTGVNSDSTINFRVIDMQGVAGGQKDNLLRVTIQILPTASSGYDDRSPRSGSPNNTRPAPPFQR